MDLTTPQTSYDLDTRLNSINSLAETSLRSGDAARTNRLFELAFKLLDPNESKSEPPEVKEEPKKAEYKSKFKYPPCGRDCLLCYPKPELPKVCADPGCGICHPWNKEVE